MSPASLFRSPARPEGSLRTAGLSTVVSCTRGTRTLAMTSADWKEALPPRRWSWDRRNGVPIQLLGPRFSLSVLTDSQSIPRKGVSSDKKDPLNTCVARRSPCRPRSNESNERRAISGIIWQSRNARSPKLVTTGVLPVAPADGQGPYQPFAPLVLAWACLTVTRFLAVHPLAAAPTGWGPLHDSACLARLRIRSKSSVLLAPIPNCLRWLLPPFVHTPDIFSESPTAQSSQQFPLFPHAFHLTTTTVGDSLVPSHLSSDSWTRSSLGAISHPPRRCTVRRRENEKSKEVSDAHWRSSPDDQRKVCRAPLCSHPT